MESKVAGRCAGTTFVGLDQSHAETLAASARLLDALAPGLSKSSWEKVQQFFKQLHSRNGRTI